MNPNIHIKHSFSKDKNTPYKIKNFVLCVSKNKRKIQKNKKIDPNKVYIKK